MIAGLVTFSERDIRFAKNHFQEVLLRKSKYIRLDVLANRWYLYRY